MARIFGLLLIVLGIYVGITVYDEGVEGAFGGIFAGAPAPLVENDGPADTARPSAAAQRGSVRPSPVTERVRERVNGAMQEGFHRHTGE